MDCPTADEEEKEEMPTTGGIAGLIKMDRFRSIYTMDINMSVTGSTTSCVDLAVSRDLLAAALLPHAKVACFISLELHA